MKFTRRTFLERRTRIYIVMLAWLHQGVYGKKTEIAKGYQISRTFLYHSFLWQTCSWKHCLAMKSSCFKKIIVTSNSSSCCYAWKGHARCRVLLRLSRLWNTTPTP